MRWVWIALQGWRLTIFSVALGMVAAIFGNRSISWPSFLAGGSVKAPLAALLALLIVVPIASSWGALPIAEEATSVRAVARVAHVALPMLAILLLSATVWLVADSTLALVYLRNCLGLVGLAGLGWKLAAAAGSLTLPAIYVCAILFFSGGSTAFWAWVTAIPRPSNLLLALLAFLIGMGMRTFGRMATVHDP